MRAGYLKVSGALVAFTRKLPVWLVLDVHRNTLLQQLRLIA